MKISLELYEVYIYTSLLIPKICSYSIMLPAHVVGRNNNLVEQLWTNIDDSGNRCADGKGRKEVSRSVLPHIKNIPNSSIGPLPPPPLWESPRRQPYKRERRRIACRVLLWLDYLRTTWCYHFTEMCCLLQPNWRWTYCASGKSRTAWRDNWWTNRRSEVRDRIYNLITQRDSHEWNKPARMIHTEHCITNTNRFTHNNVHTQQTCQQYFYI